MTAVELKFNCFFLMPLIDTFPTRLREELEAAYEEDLDEVRLMAMLLDGLNPNSDAQAISVQQSAWFAAGRVCARGKLHLYPAHRSA